MRRLMPLGLMCFILYAASAKADTVNGVTSSAGTTDSVTWGQLGTDFSTISNPFTATSVDGVTVTGSFATGAGQVIVQGDGWDGNFTPGDYLVWTSDNGPLTLGFSQGVSEAGAQIESDYFGDFTAEIEAYDGATLLGSFTENGDTTSAGDGSAIFIGLEDLSGADITSAVFSLSGCTSNCADFAIDTLDLTDGPVSTSAPEPGSLPLLACGLVGLGLLLAKRRVVHN